MYIIYVYICIYMNTFYLNILKNVFFNLIISLVLFDSKMLKKYHGKNF